MGLCSLNDNDIMCILAGFIVYVIFVVYSTILNGAEWAETWRKGATMNTNSRTKNVELKLESVMTCGVIRVYMNKW